MPQPELLVFFRTNTQDLPETTQKWFQLPSQADALKALDPAELRRRILAGEDMRSILGITTPIINDEAKEFIGEFVDQIQNPVGVGRAEEIIDFATTRLAFVAEQFSGTDLMVVRTKVYEGRAHASGYLVERGSLRVKPTGDKLRSFCVLSTAIDLMRADLESGKVTGRGDTISECFGYAQMELLQRKAVGKVAGQTLEVVYGNTLKPTRRFSTPTDPEIRDMQRAVLARLIPGVSSE